MEFEKSKDDQRKCAITTLVLGFVVVTAALVSMTVLGGLYLTRLQNDSGKQELQPLHLQSRYTRTERDVLDDREQQVELIKNKDQNGRVVSLVSLHYKQNIISMHVPEKNLCFLIGGIMKEAGSFDDDVPFRVTLVTLGQTIPKTEETQLAYTINSDNQVSNSHIQQLTTALSPYCTNTNTYWLERKATTGNESDDMTTPATNGRKKRDVCFFCGVSVNVDCCSLL